MEVRQYLISSFSKFLSSSKYSNCAWRSFFGKPFMRSNLICIPITRVKGIRMYCHGLEVGPMWNNIWWSQTLIYRPRLLRETKWEPHWRWEYPLYSSIHDLQCSESYTQYKVTLFLANAVLSIVLKLSRTQLNWVTWSMHKPKAWLKLERGTWINSAKTQ